jgi:hypothetical protein
VRRSLWFWLLLAVLVVLVLGLLFGGYRKGSVVNEPGPSSSAPSRLVVVA